MRPCGASSSARRSHAPDARLASANTARLAPRGRPRVRRGAGFAARTRSAPRGVTLPNCLAPSNQRHLERAALSDAVADVEAGLIDATPPHSRPVEKLQ